MMQETLESSESRADASVTASQWAEERVITLSLLYEFSVDFTLALIQGSLGGKA